MGPPATSPQGLSAAEAGRLLAVEGPNTLPAAGRRGSLAIAAEVLREPMFLLLVAAATVYLMLGDVREAIVLFVSLLAVVGITVAQERKSERALDALRDLASPRALVVRDSERVRVAGAEVVRGDLILLSEGDRVPADARLETVNDLMVDESLLTGESLPVEKGRGAPAYSGTLVVKGQGAAVVTATGPRTEFGRIGQSLATLEAGKTRLQEETGRIVRYVAILAVTLCVLLAAYTIAVRGDWLAGILAGLTLAMALLPEEFPVVLTIFLALGAWRIARDGVLTRRMPAIETLGAATVLCVDKTGTLTENRMAVAEVIGARRDAILEAAALACELEPFDPMERAIVAAAGERVASLRGGWRLAKDYPFTPDFLAVCHGWSAPDGERRAVVKGAPETVLALARVDGDAARRARAQFEEASERGLRLLAVAESAWTGADWPADPRGYEWTWLGFVALADPLRRAVPGAIEQCRRAGVRVVMITGDFPGTALAIAREAGIETGGGALTGARIAGLDDEGLAQAVRSANVFARIRPEQKLRLVEALKASGEVVGMTGDGVNDAPALKASHIGVAMGKRGTDVAREASALVLLEDDFQSIVAAIRLGRRIYENIRNAMRYLLAVHVPIAGMSFLPVAFGWPAVLFPVHVVFLEFVIDPACSIVFEAERSDRDVMDRPPRNPREPLFNWQMLAVSLLLGGTVLTCVGAAYWWVIQQGLPEGESRSFGFAAIVFGNLAMIHATRTRRPGLAAFLNPNPALWWITGGTLVALAASIYVAPVADLFRFAPLAPDYLAVAAAAGSVGVLWYEVYKRFRPRAG